MGLVVAIGQSAATAVYAYRLECLALLCVWLGFLWQSVAARCERAEAIATHQKDKARDHDAMTRRLAQAKAAYYSREGGITAAKRVTAHARRELDSASKVLFRLERELAAAAETIEDMRKALADASARPRRS